MIDAAVLILVGSAMQAAAPVSALIERRRARRGTLHGTRALPFTPLPRSSRDLDELLVVAGAALDLRR